MFTALQRQYFTCTFLIVLLKDSSYFKVSNQTLFSKGKVVTLKDNHTDFINYTVRIVL